MRSKSLAALAAPALVLLAPTAAPAWAHHAFGADDMNQTKTFKGTIKDFRWGAPHSSLSLTSIDARGKTVDSNGAPGGAMSTMEMTDGRTYRDGEAFGAAPNAQSGQ